MSRLAASPTVLCDASDGRKVGDAVLLEIFSYFYHGLCVACACMPVERYLKGGDQSATRVVSRSVGITMLEPQMTDELPQSDLLVVLTNPEHLVARKYLCVDVPDHRANRIHVERYRFVLEVVLVVADIVAQDHDGMVSCQTGNVLDGLHKQIVHDLACFREGDKAPLAKPIAVYSTRVWVSVWEV